MKIYTGSGDRGKTSLFSGERILKSDDRIEAFGDIDELNSLLGVLVKHLPSQAPELAAEIEQVQADLFQVGAWLATTAGSAAVERLVVVSEARIRFLEAAMDRMTADLAPLRGFILPGGHVAAAWAHLARTVCRRAERHVVALFERIFDAELPAAQARVLIYVNRLSDYLFTLARYLNHVTGVAETLWSE